MISQIKIPDVFEGLVEPHPIKAFYGGRGGGKSTSFALALLAIGIKEKKRILCTREIQGSIRDSVHKLLSTCIENYNLNKHYTIYRDSIRGRNGTEFIFHGLKHDPQQIKSLEGIDITWAEECQTIPAVSWRILTPTILRKKNSELWLSLNPNLETDPTYQQFIVNQRPNQLTVKVNWDENPYFTDELKAEMEYQKKLDYEDYLHIWEGECRRATAAQIFKNKSKVIDFDAPEDATFYYGLDWGFSQDPTVILRCHISDNCLWIDHEFIRSFKMVYIHSRCMETASEFLKYSYKVDRLTEDILPAIVDNNNHYIDALRYALQPMIKRKGKPKLAKVIGV